jgi:hypothetical protein
VTGPFRRALPALCALLCALALSGCIDSADPILSSASPEFGPKLNLQFYSLSKDAATEPSRESFTWNGALYVHAGGARTVDSFTVHPFENGDYIVQSLAGKDRKVEYALLRKLAEGVYLARAIDEEDADEQTRTALCTKGGKYSCRIETRDQLFTFARATAARKYSTGGLVLRLPEGAEKPRRAAKQPVHRRPAPR